MNDDVRIKRIKTSTNKEFVRCSICVEKDVIEFLREEGKKDERSLNYMIKTVLGNYRKNIMAKQEERKE